MNNGDSKMLELIEILNKLSDNRDKLEIVNILSGKSNVYFCIYWNKKFEDTELQIDKSVLEKYAYDITSQDIVDWNIYSKDKFSSNDFLKSKPNGKAILAWNDNFNTNRLNVYHLLDSEFKPSDLLNWNLSNNTVKVELPDFLKSNPSGKQMVLWNEDEGNKIAYVGNFVMSKPNAIDCIEWNKLERNVHQKVSKLEFLDCNLRAFDVILWNELESDKIDINIFLTFKPIDIEVSRFLKTYSQTINDIEMMDCLELLKKYDPEYEKCTWFKCKYRGNSDHKVGFIF